MHGSGSDGLSIGRCRSAAIGLSACVVLFLTLILTSAAAAAPQRSIYDPAATPDWTAQLNGYGNALDSATSAVATSSGLYVGGWAGNSAGNWDATLAKFSTSGKRLWLKRYNGPAHNLDLLWAIAKGPGGTIYGAGTTQAGQRKLDILLVKWSAGGARLWVRTYDGPAHSDDVAVALGVDRYGSVTVAGSSGNGHDLDYVVVRWSSAGVRKYLAGKSAWRYGGGARQDDAATDVHVESGGTTYVTGNIRAAGPVDAALTVKFTTAGAKAWSKSYRGAKGLGANAKALCPRPGGGVYVAGWSQWGPGSREAKVLRYASSGSFYPLPSFMDFDLSDVAVTANRCIVAVGRGQSGGGLLYAARMIWNSEQSNPLAGYFPFGATATATAVTADAFGGYYATGYSEPTIGKAQIFTVRSSLVALQPSGFVSLWGPALALDVPSDVVATGTRAYVVGTTGHATQGSNQVVLCYTY